MIFFGIEAFYMRRITIVAALAAVVEVVVVAAVVAVAGFECGVADCCCPEGPKAGHCY